MEVGFRKLSTNAQIPTQGSSLSAGLDLYSAHGGTVSARNHVLVKTDIQVILPEGTYGRVAPRSGLAYRNGLDVGAGVIDRDYTGNVGVILFNHTDLDFIYNEGDRIAQLIIEKCATVECRIVEHVDAPEDVEGERGSRGYGSTGL